MNSDEQKLLPIRRFTTTKEVICNYEICVLLKQAGFNWPCKIYYDLHGEHHILHDETFQNSIYDSYKIACPSLDIAVSWLRIEKKIPIQMLYSKVKDEWASCVDEKYYWSCGYYISLAEGLIQGLKIVLNLECLQIRFV